MGLRRDPSVGLRDATLGWRLRPRTDGVPDLHELPMTVETPTPIERAGAPTRDRLLDLLRSVSIVRVIFIHLLGHGRFWFWPNPTWVMPGMPIVFFVSGSLAFRSLRTKDGSRRPAPTYWKRTFRRLLLPFWAYYGTVAAFAVVADLTHRSRYWDVDYVRLLVGATGLVIPNASKALRHHTGHLWFMCVFLVMAAAAPYLVRAFERARWAVLGTLVAAFVYVQWLVLERDVDFVVGGYELQVEKLAAFAIPYLVGFWYTEGSLRAASRRSLAVALVLATAGAWYWNGVESGAVNASQTKHLLVGGAWLLVALLVAPLLRVFADRHREVIDRITPRTFTVYLWGWTTCVFAADWADELVAPGWGNRGLMALGSLVFLGIAVRSFGWVEDVSARRPGAQDRPNAPATHMRFRPRRFAS